jgi:thiol:disulfide interchange protein DsbC
MFNVVQHRLRALRSFASAVNGARLSRAVLLGLLLQCCACFIASPTLASDIESRARALAERAHPGKKIESFRKLPNAPFYEIWIGRGIVYTDLDATVLFIGNLFDAKTLASLTEARKTELQRFSLESIPTSTIIKTVRGNGRNAIYVFADPNCAFCKSFEAELLTLTDITIHTVLYPVLGADSIAKSRDILCAASPERAWRVWIDSGIAPPTAAASCQPSFTQILEFGSNNDIGLTPTTIYGIGDRVVGQVPAAAIDGVLKRVRR